MLPLCCCSAIRRNSLTRALHAAREPGCSDLRPVRSPLPPQWPCCQIRLHRSDQCQPIGGERSGQLPHVGVFNPSLFTAQQCGLNSWSAARAIAGAKIACASRATPPWLPCLRYVLAGKPAPKERLIDLARLEREYYERRPDLDDPQQLVSFGTSGRRGSPLAGRSRKPCPHQRSNRGET
jgi:hypothetical protein